MSDSQYILLLSFGRRKSLHPRRTALRQREFSSTAANVLLCCAWFITLAYTELALCSTSRWVLHPNRTYDELEEATWVVELLHRALKESKDSPAEDPTNTTGIDFLIKRLQVRKLCDST